MKRCLGIILLASCALAPKANTQLGSEWNYMGTAGFTPRRNFGIAVEGGEIYVVGGFTKSGTTAPLLVGDVWYSGDGGKSWIEQTPRAPFLRRQAFGLVVFKGELYVIGGFGEAGVLLEDVWKSADKGKTWVEVTSSAGFGMRYGHGTAVKDGAIHVIGGRNAGSRFGDMWKSTDGSVWVKLADPPFRGRDGLGFMVYKGDFIAAGGHGDIPLTDVWRGGEAEWFKLRNLPFELWHGGLREVNGDIFALEGPNVWRSIDEGESWEKLVFDAPYGNRDGFGLVAIDRKLLYIGGRDIQNSEYHNDIWVSQY